MALLTINEMAEATFDDPTAKREQPSVNNGDGQEQARRAIGVLEMSDFKIKPVAFQVSVHLLRGQIGIADAGVSVAVTTDDQQLGIGGLGPADELLHQHRLAAPDLADDK